MNWKIWLLVLISYSSLEAHQEKDTLYFNSGTLNLQINGPTFPYKALNPSSTYAPQAHRIDIKPADTLKLVLVNNDTVPHSFIVRETGFGISFIPPAGVDSLELFFSNQGVFLYYDSLNDNSILGLSGLLRVWPDDHSSFYWNLKEHQSDLNLKLVRGQPFDPDTFFADGFTINERSHPSTLADSTAVISGNVGDTLLIFLSNSGLMDHSIHYHGYHVELFYSSEDNSQLNWIKDSIPIKAGECQVHRLVPDQPGTFPVHDHNLVSTTIGGNSPGGMLLHFTIDP